MMRFTHTQYQNRLGAYTLVELLVVVALIGVMVALLSPVFSKARSRNQQNQCVINLRRLGMAMLTYAADNDNRMVLGLYKSGNMSLPWSRILNGSPGLNYLAPDQYPPVSIAAATKRSPFDCPARPSAAYYDNLHYGYSTFPSFKVYDDYEEGLQPRLSAIARPGHTLLLGEITSGYRFNVYLPATLPTPHKDVANAYYADGSIRQLKQPFGGAHAPFY